MRVLGIISALLFMQLLVPQTVVDAEAVPPKQQLHTSGRVVASQSIIVDDQGTIIQILSNTTEDVVPKVYLLTIGSSTQQPMTADIFAQYRKHVPEGKSRVGVLYQKSILESSLVPQETFTSFLRPPNLSGTVALSVSL